MSIWPGNAYFGYRYDYATEYVSVMKELWASGVSNFKGKHFTMNDCKMSPKPSSDIKIVAAGQSGRGMEFASQFADFNFAMGTGINTPTAFAPSNERLVAANETAGKDCGAYVLFMVIADETDDAAEKKWQFYKDGADVEALAWMADQGSKDTKADANATAKAINLPEGAVNFNTGTLVGSYAKVAGMLDEIAAVPGTKGIMLIFDDFLVGMDNFGQKIQPLMKCRADIGTHAA
jgi:pyrimidine oxygenase